MTTLGTSRAPWYLGVLGVVVVAVVAVGTLIERGSATPPDPAGTSWAQVAPGSSTTPGPTGNALVAPVAPATPAGSAARYVFPVSGTVTYERTHHDYPAADIIAACGSPVVAVTNGVVLEVSRKDTYDSRSDDGAARGGLFVSLLGDDGVRYYGSHFKSLSAGIDVQVRVRAGDRLGEVGDSGDAGVCHLHFGLSPPCAGLADWWLRRGAVWPWSYLDAWLRGDPVSPAPEVAAWNRANGCPGAP